MTKYIFATKFKKIEKEPLYYNMQVSVDKDYAHPGGSAPGMPDVINFYKDSPIILPFASVNYWIPTNDYNIYIDAPGSTTTTNLYFFGYYICSICEGHYPLPEIISVVYIDVTFTFTPIPVYE